MCKTFCRQGTFGQNCSSECQCQNAVRCDHKDGQCFCSEGWFGVDCSMPCPSGQYGKDCQHACACQNNATCHHVDGNCTCESPWTGQWCEVMQTDIQTSDMHQLPLQISVPLLLVLFVSAALVVSCMWKRATRVKQDEGLAEAQALLELTGMEEKLAQSLQPGWLNRWERKTKDLTLGQLIGLGTFAHIRKGHLRIDNAEVTVAVKSVRAEDKLCYQAFCREVSALIAVHENQEQIDGDSNIVRLFGVITKSTPKCVLLEYASGDLLQLLKRLRQQTERRRLDRVLLLSDVLRYAVHISRALEELRRLPIAHGDVAARNVLISGDDIAKLTDFGLARDVYSTISHAASVKTDAKELLPLKWMALESLKCRQFTCESDTWSFGVLLWEIASFGEEPNYQEMVQLTCPNLVEFLRRGMRLLKPRGCPKRLYDVMKSCWWEEPSARPTPEELEQKLTECRHEIDLQFVERESAV
ncbi:Endothelial cell-specific molecule 1 [Branchiostoma belcheri]|nr:Endothelial cell-specific molecule 1 [Branchiostoma belcheri]